MHFDFWNNPIIVTAFRVRHRRGGFLHFTTLYMIVLVLVGAVMAYYNEFLFQGRRQWQQNYFMVVLGLQFLVSPLLAAVATSASIKSEVVNRTLDFQRIAALSPRQILFGKLLGEPALAYLLALATIPLSVWCMGMGVKGLTVVELVLFYVLLFTTTLLFGAVGLLNRLEVGDGKAAGAGATGGTVWGWIMMSMWVAIGNGVMAGATPWYAVPAGLLTPILPLFGMAQDDPWMHYAPLYGHQLPYLILTPVVQLFLAFLCFQAMVRRMNNPLNTAVHKGMAYLTLILVDALATATLYDPLPQDVGALCTQFCLIHLCVCVGLIAAVTPWRETLHSWVWRYRGRSNRLWDLWLGQRSENGLALLTFSIVGALSLGLLLVVPLGVHQGWDKVRHAQDTIMAAALLTAALTLTFGIGYQWFEFIAGRGSGPFVTLTVLAVGLPHLLGRVLQLDLLLACSPSAHYLQWIVPHSPLVVGHPLPLWPVLACCFVALAAMWLHLRAMMRRLEASVDRKLHEMGVPQAARSGL